MPAWVTAAPLRGTTHWSNEIVPCRPSPPPLQSFRDGLWMVLVLCVCAGRGSRPVTPEKAFSKLPALGCLSVQFYPILPRQPLPGRGELKEGLASVIEGGCKGLSPQPHVFLLED